MGLIPADKISLILDRCDIVEIISGYVPLKAAGRNFRAVCPFHHEKTPSFMVNPEKQIFHCFGCGVGGNVISFVMRKERMDFPEAVRLLAEKTGVVLDQAGPADSAAYRLKKDLQKANALAAQYFHQVLLTSQHPEAKSAREYLKGRSVSLDVVRQFRIGYAFSSWDDLIQHLRGQDISLRVMEQAGLILGQSQGKGFYDRFRSRIMFPIFDQRGDCVAFGGRTVEKDNTVKYMNSPETALYIKGQHLYGLHMSREAVGREDLAVIVEGYMDFLTPFQNGVRHIVASLGTALTVQQVRLLRRYTRNVVMLFDSDQAGQAAMLRSLDLLIQEGMEASVASLGEGMDPDAFIRQHGAELFAEKIGKAVSVFEYKLGQLCQKWGSQTVEQCARVIGEMLPTISKFDNQIVKAGYLKRLAEQLQVSHEAVVAEYRKLTSAGGPRPQQEPPIQTQIPSRPEPVVAMKAAERTLLQLMLREKTFVSLTRQAVELADFQNPQAREIAQKVFELEEKDPAVDFRAVMAEFEDEGILSLLSGLVASGGPEGDQSRIHRDCVDRLKKDRAREYRQKIIHEMDQARRAGDQQKLDELTVAFNQLMKG